MSVFDEIRFEYFNAKANNISRILQFHFSANREGAKVSQGIRYNWWRQGMMGQ